MGIATSQKSLNVLCPSFDKSGQMPKKHTGFLADISRAISGRYMRVLRVVSGTTLGLGVLLAVGILK